MLRSGRTVQELSVLITLKNVDKTFPVAGDPFFALRDINLGVAAGELVLVVGRSGSGKSTLLNMIAGLDRPTRGEVHVCGIPVHELDEDGLAKFRAHHIGVVFQFFQLLPTLTAAENVMLAMDFVGTVAAGERRDRAHCLLDEVGVGDQADKLTRRSRPCKRVQRLRRRCAGPRVRHAGDARKTRSGVGRRCLFSRTSTM